MNLYKTRGLKNYRIDVADALRGLAVAGIILIHATEQFNMYSPSYGNPALLACDSKVSEIMFWLFSGKMYGIFAMLFGLSFFIQNDNQQQKGKDFSLRFLWRMVLLFILGIINTAFYDGDILMSYAVYALILIPLSYLPSVWSWIVFGILIVQPVEIYSLLSGWRPDLSGMGEAYGAMGKAHHYGSLLDNMAANLQYGQKATALWILAKGRHTQTVALFILGMLLGRYRMFYNEGKNLRIWGWTFVVSLIVSIAYNVSGLETVRSISNLVSPIASFFLLLAIVSGFVNLWYRLPGFCKAVSSLQTFGKMSLTNYFLQSIIGTTLFCAYGFDLCAKLGITYSVLVGVAILIAQYTFCVLWFKKHDHGPMEMLWKKLTWISFRQQKG